uniref:Uncharacterized protein n=1 Tax=viral metagenome TaxID=1070528 RepID=A0A6C0LKY7_9ZZZZ
MSNKPILELETLNKEYDVTLTRYNKAMRDYIQMTQAANESTTTQCAANYGTTDPCCGNEGRPSVAPQYVCQSGTPVCKGYVYGSQWGTCGVNTTKEKRLLKLIGQLNDKLTEIANEVDDMEADLQPEMNKDLLKSKKQTKTLNANLKELNVEKIKIKRELDKLNELDAENNQGGLIVTSNYWTYITLIIIMLICILGIVALGAFSNKTGTQAGGKFLKRTR